MSKRTSFLLSAALVVAAAVPVVAQMGARLPTIRGVWNPVVGGGALYEQVEQDGAKKTVSVAVIGKEDVNGEHGYWVEMGITKDSGDTYIQMLTVAKDGMVHATKSVVMIPGRGPFEMPAGMNRGQADSATDLHGDSEKVGSESVTTPAGTFDCDHWRAKDGSYDAWVSPKVTPWGVVKGTGTHGSLTLMKLVTDAKSHIIGTPQKFDPSMMGRRGN